MSIIPGERVEGQVWISRESPNVLKYFAGDTEYWTVAASTYPASAAVEKGSIVAASSSASGVARVRAALWPRDAHSVVGIALNSAAAGQMVRTVSYGYIELNEQDIKDIFVTQADYMATAILSSSSYYSAFGTTSDGGGGNGWVSTSGEKIGIGAPVYLFSGRHLKTSSGYSWKDPSLFPGKLTIATPSGYKPTGCEVPWNDARFDVMYEGLPQIGTVVKYDVNGAGQITTMTLHINFALLSTIIRFTSPGKGVWSYTEVGTHKEVPLLHGLFPSIAETNICVPNVKVEARGYEKATLVDGSYEIDWSKGAFAAHPGYDSVITGDTRGTTVDIKSDTAFFYKIVGEVQYSG